MVFRILEETLFWESISLYNIHHISPISHLIYPAQVFTYMAYMVSFFLKQKALFLLQQIKTNYEKNIFIDGNYNCRNFICTE